MPRSLSHRANQMTSGVLPVPPAVMLPTTTTGTGARQERLRAVRKRRRRRMASQPNSAANGHSRRGQTRSSYQAPTRGVVFAAGNAGAVELGRSSPERFSNCDS